MLLTATTTTPALRASWELAEQPDAGPDPDGGVDGATLAEGAQESVGDGSVAEEPDESERVAVGPAQPATRRTAGRARDLLPVVTRRLRTPRRTST